MKRFLERALLQNNNPTYFVISDILAVVTVISILSLVLETVPRLDSYRSVFLVIEWVAVTVFTIEYAARIYITKPTYRYVFSFFGFIDLISILPTFFGVGNFTFLKSARAIRLIRLLRMVRLAKMKHLNTRDVEEKMGFSTVNILLFLTVTLFSMLVVGTLIYVVEGSNSAFSSIPISMYWAFKLFLLNIPIEYPSTPTGEAVLVFGRLVGLTVFGVLVGVVGNLCKDFLFTSKKT